MKKYIKPDISLNTPAENICAEVINIDFNSVWHELVAAKD